MPVVSTDIPDSIFKKIVEDVRLGVFKNASEAINTALTKNYAKKSRTYLKGLVKNESINEESFLRELKNLRK